MNKKQFSNSKPIGARPRAGQDIVSPAHAAKFPSVGMSLPSYSSKPSSRRSSTVRTAAASRVASMGGVGSYAGGAAKKTAAPKAKANSSDSRFSRFKQKITLKRAVITLLLIVLVIGGILGGKFLYNANKIFGGSILDVLQTTELRGEENGRVNILLAGNSADDLGHDGAELTDSILILSIDTRNKKAFMLSVPRDFYVDVYGDGESYAKINSAYPAGENNEFAEEGFPEGGMGQLEKVINDSFGLDINYYALVNYNAVKQAVDAVGGIDITVASDDRRGLYDPNIDYTTGGPLVNLTNGPHTLDGQAALNFARARGDSARSYGYAQSDFTRTQNQRQMLLALKNKAVSAGTLSNPARLSGLADAIGGNVETDFNLSEVRRLYELTKDIDTNTVTSLSLNDVDGVNLLENYRSPRGESALIPAAGLGDYSDIKALTARLTSNNPVVQEGGTAVVLNGSEATGIASAQRERVEDKGLIVSDIDNALEVQPGTTIIDISGGTKPAALAALKSLYPRATVTTTNPYDGVYGSDFIIIAGADQVPAETDSTSQ